MQQIDPVLGGFLGRSPGNDFHQAFPVGDSCLVGPVSFIIRQMRQPRGLAETPELAVVADGQNDEAVPGFEVLIGNGIGMRIAHSPRDVSGIQKIRPLVGKAGDLHVEQRQIDVLPDPVDVPGPDRGKNGGRRVQAGQYVGQGDADFHGAAAGLFIWPARDAHHSAHALHEKVVARPVRVGAVLAEPGYGAVDDARVHLPDRLVIEAVLLQASHLMVFDENVEAPGQFLDQPLAFFPADVDGDGLLVPVRAEVVGGVDRRLPALFPKEGRPPGPGVVAFVGFLDLDHVRPQVAQCLGGPGPGKNPREIEDFDAVQSAFPCHHCFSMFALRAILSQRSMSSRLNSRSSLLPPNCGFCPNLAKNSSVSGRRDTSWK